MMEKVLIWAAAGGAMGYLWHRLAGCSTGACPIVRSPYLSILWGAAIGLSLALGK